jgi:hypothetical protein
MTSHSDGHERFQKSRISITEYISAETETETDVISPSEAHTQAEERKHPSPTEKIIRPKEFPVVIFTIGNSTYFEVKIPENSDAERDFSLHFGFQTNWVSRRAREEWQFFFMKQSSKMALEAAADAIAKREKKARTQKTNTQAAPNQRLSRRIDPGKDRVSQILAAWAGPTSYPSCHLPDLEARFIPGGYNIGFARSLSLSLSLCTLECRVFVATSDRARNSVVE